jgi:hypothetical protein
MAVVTNVFTTATAKGIREDLTDQIHRVDVEETPFISTVPSTTAKSTLHDWQTEALDGVDTDNAKPEGQATARAAANNTVRLQNVCQISEKNATVSGTMEAVDKAGRDKEMSRQLAIRTIALRKDMESILLRNQAFATNATVGGETGVRTLRGFEAWIRTNTNRGPGSGTAGADPADPNVTPGTTATDANATRAITETLLLDTLQEVYVSGGNVKMAMLGVTAKRTASGFAGRTGTNIDVSKKEIQQAANMYRSDFGDINLMAHRYMRQRTAILLDPSKVKVAYLRRFVRFPLAKVGDADTNVILSEYTLEMCNERAHGVIADLTA